MRLSRAVVFSLASLGIGLFAVACSEQGAASQADSPVKVVVSQMFVTVRNESGLPLQDVTVSIVPPARTTVYSKYFPRLENAESRDLMIGDFSGRDGTPLNLRVVKPRSIEVKATDVNGKEYEITMPWQ